MTVNVVLQLALLYR